jgi:RpiR family transcriptional regulator, carbohydrate utilization regulator
MYLLHLTLNIMNSDVLEQAVSVLNAARKIDFYGNGGSGVIAMDAHHKFIRTGKNSSAYSDTHMQLMSASQLTEKDAAVFISHSGTNKDLLDVLSVAKENGAVCIAITNYATTPLSKQADLVFYTVSEETAYRSEALSSRIAQLTIVDLLFVNFMMKNKDRVQDSIQKIAKCNLYEKNVEGEIKDDRFSNSSCCKRRYGAAEKFDACLYC